MEDPDEQHAIAVAIQWTLPAGRGGWKSPPMVKVSWRMLGWSCCASWLEQTGLTGELSGALACERLLIYDRGVLCPPVTRSSA